MKDKIKKLRLCLDNLFDESILNKSYIEVLDKEEMILAANIEGYIYLFDQVLNLCENGLIGGHCHIDNYSIADKCEKSLTIKLINSPC